MTRHDTTRTTSHPARCWWRFQEQSREQSEELSPQSSSEEVRLSGGPFCPTATMIVTGPILVGAPKAGPVPDERSRGGSGPVETSEQMMGFGGSQGDEWTSQGRWQCWH